MASEDIHPITLAMKLELEHVIGHLLYDLPKQAELTGAKDTQILHNNIKKINAFLQALPVIEADCEYQLFCKDVILPGAYDKITANICTKLRMICPNNTIDKVKFCEHKEK